MGDAKLTGRPGVAFVSRGPGATNASIAVHVAEQDAVPLVLFVGQVPRAEIGRRSFQEVDYGKTFADMAKAVYLIHDAARIPEIVARAFAEAQAPTPGPVVVVLPEDMLEDMAEAPVVEPLRVPQAGPASAADIEEIAAMIAKAERPLLIAGGAGLGTARGRKALLAASEAHALPVALTFKRQDYFPNAHPNYAGHLGFKIPKAAAERYLEADLMLAVGTRLGEVSTQGYTLPASPAPRQPLIHIHDDPRQLGRNYSAAKALVADPVAVLEALARLPGKAPPAAVRSGSRSSTSRWPRPCPGHRRPTACSTWDRWWRRWPSGSPTTPFSSPTPATSRAGCTGTSRSRASTCWSAASAARWASACRPRWRRRCVSRERQVINFLGDGGALMTGSELATAVQYGAKVKTFISNNGSYATIRMHQEIAYKGRVHGTELKNPDFAKWAESFGALGLTISSIEEARGRGGAGAGPRRPGGGGREDGGGAHHAVCDDHLACAASRRTTGMEAPVTLVTGVSRGIGRAIAEEMTALGHHVVGIARSHPGDWFRRHLRLRSISPTRRPPAQPSAASPPSTGCCGSSTMPASRGRARSRR